MKSKFFGNGAKLALAVLAVCGTLFTSCYEKAEVDQSKQNQLKQSIILLVRLLMRLQARN